ncbi:MAG: LLM class flavin-dependent oxidoreductase [Actinobacteria bacterium]|nr:LLM class flavin-dependent oxidoreductase [Actinomycetota bacterium]
MTVAVNILPVDARHTLELGRAADRAGFERLLLADGGRTTHDPWVVLGALAETTAQIKLGMITNPYTRRPEVTANALRSLDELSGGRAYVTLAAGGQAQLEAMGAKRERPITAVREALASIRERKPDTEIWVATKGEKLLAITAREADGVLLSGIPLDRLPALVESVRAQARPDFTIAFTLHHAHDDSTMQDARERLVFELMNLRPDLRETVGVDDGTIEEMRASLVATGSPSGAAALVPDELVARFYLVCDRLDLAAEVAALRETAGVDTVVLPERSLFEAYEAAAPGLAAAAVGTAGGKE